MKWSQGDANVYSVAFLPTQVTKVEDNVFVRGNNNHTLKGGEVFTTESGEVYLSVTDSKGELLHAQHNTITLEPGVYRVKIAREWDYFSNESRAVRD